MQPAPAVAFVCDDGGRWRALRAALPALAGAALAAWLARRAEATPIASALMAALTAATVAASAWRRLGAEPRVRLRWDGARWYALTGGPPDDDAGTRVRVAVALDVGDWMLLRLRVDEAADGAPDALAPSARVGARLRRARSALRGARWCALHGAGSAVRAALHAPRLAERPGVGRAGA